MYKRKVMVPLYSPDRKTLLRCPEKYKGVFEIPCGVESIAPKAFYGCENITGVKIPNSVLVIDNEAFMECSELTFVEFEKGSQVASIGKGAFSCCKKLTSINIPEQVTEIESQTFYNCTSLRTVTMPDDIAIIGESSFCKCSSLETVILPANLLTIKRLAFNLCVSLKKIVIPDSVESIREYAFDTCKNLLKVLIGVNSCLKIIEQGAFNNCYRLASVYIPDSISVIEKHTFGYCDSLKSLFIPAWVDNVSVEIAPMCNMDFTFFCEAEPRSSWHEGWNRMGGYIEAGHDAPIAPTMFNVPRWWYEKFAAPRGVLENLVRITSEDKNFDKEKMKEFIANTKKTLYLTESWEWSGVKKKEVSKEKMMEVLDTFDYDGPEKENILEIKEYENSVLVSAMTGLPF